MAALACLSSACNVTLSTVTSHHLISSDAEALGCDIFMQSLFSELYSIWTLNESSLLSHCLLSAVRLKTLPAGLQLLHSLTAPID